MIQKTIFNKFLNSTMENLNDISNSKLSSGLMKISNFLIYFRDKKLLLQNINYLIEYELSIAFTPLE